MRKKAAVLLSTLAVVGTLAFALNTDAQSTNSPSQHRTERHPAIRRALVTLREAKAELEHADHDFGGHRIQAMQAVDQAMEQLKLALQHDKK
jgi:type II secretory pathway component PulJ